MDSSNVPDRVEEDSVHTVEIEELGEEGDGIAYVDDYVLVVPDGTLGETVTVRVQSVQPNFARATVEDVETDLT